jgi:hypothetical protein
MLEKIAVIASVICALTAVTTSLRALGKSREQSRYETVSKLVTSSRVYGYTAHRPETTRKNLFLHLAVTIIWFILSLVFSAPLLIQRWAREKDIMVFLWVLLFVCLGIILWFIWRRVLLRER